MRTPKFNFIPERQLNEPAPETKFKVSIYSGGTLVFPTDVVHVYELDGKYIRMYADRERRSIGWSIFKHSANLEEMKDLRQLKVTVNGNIVIGIKKLLNSMGVTEVGSGFKGLEVGTYKGVLESNEIFYVTLPEPEANVSLNGKKV